MCRTTRSGTLFIIGRLPGRHAGTPRQSTGYLSYLLCYRIGMAQRQKRSISLPPELAEAIEQAASSESTTVSGWLADTAAHRLRLDAGRRAIAEWEADNGPLTAEELADGLARARALLRRSAAGQPTRRSV
jgi:hypothetical protein